MNMTSIAIRQKLHQFIDTIDEKKAKAIYTLFENEIEESGLEYSDEFKAELDKRVEYYRNGGKMVSPAEMNKRIKAIRQKAR
jgi:hypothetical protein